MAKKKDYSDEQVECKCGKSYSILKILSHIRNKFCSAKYTTEERNYLKERSNKVQQRHRKEDPVLKNRDAKNRRKRYEKSLQNKQKSKPAQKISKINQSKSKQLKSKLVKKFKDLENVELKSNYKEKIKVLKIQANETKINDNDDSKAIKALTTAEAKAVKLILTSIRKKSPIVKKYNEKEYIFLQGILERNVFEDKQNFPRDNFSLSAIISKLSAERSEARHS